ncbi:MULTISPECIES: hypothetical protein [Streptomyces]|uniref:hypothetical protein n=1 Tax=Streptomyces TaxID=1883 RepID=UPI0016784FEB|nr:MULTISPECIES: hypothetical protein [Streptomyces]MBK3522761.1 hypothetical protein [Streptomyces sp. MBT70]
MQLFPDGPRVCGGDRVDVGGPVKGDIDGFVGAPALKWSQLLVLPCDAEDL